MVESGTQHIKRINSVAWDFTRQTQNKDSMQQKYFLHYSEYTRIHAKKMTMPVVFMRNILTSEIITIYPVLHVLLKENKKSTLSCKEIQIYFITDTQSLLT